MEDLTKDVAHNMAYKLLAAFIVGIIFALVVIALINLSMVPPEPVDFGGVVQRMVC